MYETIGVIRIVVGIRERCDSVDHPWRDVDRIFKKGHTSPTRGPVVNRLSRRADTGDGNGQGGGVGDQPTGVLHGVGKHIVGAGTGCKAVGVVGQVAVAAVGCQRQVT